MKVTSKPACSIIFADKASKQHGMGMKSPLAIFSRNLAAILLGFDMSSLR
jgi:hypothetical protein